jgi:serine/threonine protein kinase
LPVKVDDSVEVIFSAALEKGTDAERATFLKEACDGDGELWGRVDALLDAHTSAGSFLERPVLGGATIELAPPGEGPGTMIGPYKLIQLIGEGGFGSVHLAVQTWPVRRKVALKILKLGMDTRQVIARFEAERQALAMMDHPNIARVLDGGATLTGRPYFVMELVRGMPITKYCDSNNLSTTARLELFTLVCYAVQHAHQKGVIHRDIKPSNVMIALQDGRPVPKVIDFGIAKAVDRELTDQTLVTDFRQFIGTPEYMSPEQAQRDGLDVDTRADIYSLGVLLYELLTGRTPFDFKPGTEATASVMDCQRVIRDKEPYRPSARVSTLGHEVTDIARSRRTDARELNRRLRGDLDRIVMKALDKDRTRRYETANALALDIKRHLNHEPVRAAPPSACYRLCKFVQRHRAVVTGSGAAAAALIIGLALATVGFVNASAQRDLLQQEVARTQAVSAFLQGVLAPVDPAAAEGREAALRAMLDAAGERIDAGAFADQPEIEAAVRDAIGRSYQGLGHHEAAEAHLREALKIRRELLGEDHPTTQESIDALAPVSGAQGRVAQAGALPHKTPDVR